MAKWVGTSVSRREDPPLVQGQGVFTADLRVPGARSVAFLRSTHAHARIVDVELEEARLPGVRAVVTGAECPLPALPLLVPNPALHPVMPTPLAREWVHYVGEPVALVIAEDRYRAEDARDKIRVYYEALPPVLDAKSGLEADAPVLYETLGSNLAAHLVQQIGDPAAAFRTAPVVVHDRVSFGRAAAHPMETRGVVAQYVGGRLTVWSSTQTPHLLRETLCHCLGLPEHRVQVITPDVGGGFGAKAVSYPEEVAVAWAAMQFGIPLVWVEDRLEHFVAATHEREQYHESRLAVDREGRILAVENAFWADQGAYAVWGVIVPYLTSTTIPGPYKVPHYRCDGYVVYTNKTPIAPYRGAGRPQGVAVMERLLDKAARVLGMDPAEIRRRNFIPPEAFPYPVGLIYRDGSPLTYDSGDYPRLLQTAMDAVDYPALRAWQQAAKADGRLVGIGVAAYVEGTGLGPFEGVTVRLEDGGQVAVLTGSPSQGQGHDTFYAQVVADYLGVHPGQIHVVEGDTAAVPRGIGTFGSRVAAVGGGSAALAAGALRTEILEMAAKVLEAHPEDLCWDGDRIYPAGVPERALTLDALQHQANHPAPGSSQPFGVRPGLEATRYFQPDRAAYSSGVHLAVVEIDPSTAELKILRYVIAHDCGTVVNPLLVEGQVIGGLAHGISGAMYEELVYGDDGQLLTGSFLDYVIPGAGEVPHCEVLHVETPSPLNPLGVKGAGEGGTIPVYAVIGSALEDAVAGLEIDVFPVTPLRLWQGMTAATGHREPAGTT